MSRQPRLSIITATLNSERTIRRTLASVAHQQYEDVEHIIIDGGSSDRTLAIVKEFHACRGTVISEPDGGISEAFNKGITASSGDLIGILNSDDAYWPCALQDVAAAHRAHPTAVIHGNAVWQDGASRTQLRPSRAPRFYQWFDMPLLHPTCFVPRTVYDQVGLFDKCYRLAMDYEWVIRALRQGVPLVHLDRIITVYQAGGRAISHARQAHQEVRAAQRKHGLPAIPCAASHVIKTVVTACVSLPHLKRLIHRGFRPKVPLEGSLLDHQDGSR